MLLQLTILLPPECKQQLESKNMHGTVLPKELTISSAAGEVILFISVTLNDGITLTDMAMQKWALDFPGNNVPPFKVIIFSRGQTLWLPSFNYDVCGNIFKACLCHGCLYIFCYISFLSAS
jgi:hypothetical protein